MKKEVLKDLFRFSTYLKTRGYAPRTIEAYMPYVREFMAYLDTKSIEKFQEVTPEVVSQYQMYLGTELPGKKRLSLKTQNLKTKLERVLSGLLSSFFNLSFTASLFFLEKHSFPI